jgi:hypothetical protein
MILFVFQFSPVAPISLDFASIAPRHVPNITCIQSETHVDICLFLKYLLPLFSTFGRIEFQTVTIQGLGERATVLGCASAPVPAVYERKWRRLDLGIRVPTQASRQEP